VVIFFFFFSSRRRHTRLQGDWSSDVCSSDLRLALIREHLGNLILMGSRHSAPTLRLREFLERNGHPFTYVDLDKDKLSQELLDRSEERRVGKECRSRWTPYE